jgi:hypothetical protein
MHLTYFFSVTVIAGDSCGLSVCFVNSPTGKSSRFVHHRCTSVPHCLRPAMEGAPPAGGLGLSSAIVGTWCVLKGAFF